MTTIATTRLVLRPPHKADTGALVTALDNLNVSRWTGRIPHPYGPEDARAFFTHVQNAPQDALILFITRGDELIGGIGVEQGELGYWLAEPHWARGYGSEAARAVVDHSFTKLGFTQMSASHYFGNQASRRILLGLGFVVTGESRGFSRARGEDVPFVTLELSRPGWEQAKERRQ